MNFFIFISDQSEARSKENCKICISQDKDCLRTRYKLIGWIKYDLLQCVEKVEVEAKGKLEIKSQSTLSLEEEGISDNDKKSKVNGDTVENDSPTQCKFDLFYLMLHTTKKPK